MSDIKWMVAEGAAPNCPVCNQKLASVNAEFGMAEVPSDDGLWARFVSTSPTGDRLTFQPCGDVLRDEEVKPALKRMREEWRA